MIEYVTEMDMLEILRDIEEYSNSNGCDLEKAGAYICNEKLHFFAFYEDEGIQPIKKEMITHYQCLIQSYFDGISDSSSIVYSMTEWVNDMISDYNEMCVL